MNGRRVGFSGSSVRRLTPVRGFYYDVLGFPGYKRYIGASTYIAASSFLPTPSFNLLYTADPRTGANEMPARFSFVDFRASVARGCGFKRHASRNSYFSRFFFPLFSSLVWKGKIRHRFPIEVVSWQLFISEVFFSKFGGKEKRGKKKEVAPTRASCIR